MINNSIKRTYNLKIAGKDYTLSTDDPPELVHRVAVYADRVITESTAGGLISRDRAAVIACLSMAEELLNAQDDNTRLRRELMLAREQLAEAKKDE
ncbi:MAG: hypothetical protein CW338_10565 [Clostridiales bacterium]|nr:hypothetical protein [Clostridiales bacterium]